MRLKGSPDVDVNVKSMTAGRVDILEHGKPYVPGMAGLATISGDISAYIAYSAWSEGN